MPDLPKHFIERDIMLMLLQESFHREEPYKDRQNALSNFVFMKGSTPVDIYNMQLDLYIPAHSWIKKDKVRVFPLL